MPITSASSHLVAEDMFVQQDNRPNRRAQVNETFTALVKTAGPGICTGYRASGARLAIRSFLAPAMVPVDSF